MRLTPGQACFIFGWWNAKYNLLWEDVVRNPDIHFNKLLQANVSIDQIHALQPDIQLWVKEKKISKQEIFYVLNKWECDPIVDFGLDIGDLADPRFHPELLLQLGIDFKKMTDMGLTGENMRFFRHITLLNWSKLGLTKEHASKLSDKDLYLCFNMKKNDVLSSLSA
jgi:hypothetical protein